MERRKFICAGLATLGSSSFLNRRPAVGLNFELSTVPNKKPKNTDTILIDFTYINIATRYLDYNKNMTVSISIQLEDIGSESRNKTVSIQKNETIKKEDISDILPIRIGNIDTQSSVIDGSVSLQVEHPTIGTKSYSRRFEISNIPLTNGLVGYYPIEKGSGRILQNAAGQNIGQINGNLWSTTSQIGEYAFDFQNSNTDTTGSWVDLGDVHNRPDSLTLSAWVYPRELPTNDWTIIAGKAKGNNENYDLRVDQNNGDLAALVRWKENGGEGDAYHIMNTGITTTNQWYLLTLTFDSDKQEAKVYINGQEKDSHSIPQSTLNQNNYPFGIARRGTNESTNYDFFNGLIEEVRVYNRALSSNEITDVYNLSSPTAEKVTERDIASNDSGGISRYPLNGDSTGIPDIWSDNDGTDNTDSGYSTGIYDKAKVLDGTDDYISVPHDKSFNISTTGELTVSTWVKHDSLDKYDPAIYKDYDSSGRASWLIGHYGNELSFNIYGDTIARAQSGLSTQTGDWYHIVGVADNGDATLYVNGKEEANDQYASPREGSYPLNIGFGSTYYLDGQIDDARIYQRALSKSEVKNLQKLGSYRI